MPHFWFRASSSLAATLLLAESAAPGAEASKADPTLAAVVKPFFTGHCTSCHGETKQKGELRVDTLAIDHDSPKAMAHWEEIMNRINSGEMPPEEEARPNPDQVAQVAQWIAGQLLEREAKGHASGAESVSFRRLSRVEYANTIRALLGVTYDATDPKGLPEDPAWHGFERIGSVLSVSPAHIEKYLVAAEAVVHEALALNGAPPREVIRWTPFDLRGAWKNFEKDYQARGIAGQVRVDLVPNNGFLDARDLTLKTGGDYRVRVKLSGLRPAGGRAARLRLYATSVSRTLIEQDVEAPEDRPVTLEFRVHLPAGKHPIRIINAVPGPNPEARRSRASGTPNIFTNLRTRVPWQIKFTDDDGKPFVPFLLLDYIEWEGPLVDTWPTPAYRGIFFGGETAAKDDAYARQILGRFAERAFRRPVAPAEVERFAAIAAKAQTLGDTFEAGIAMALQAILTSKSFLYLEEGSAAAARTRLTDWELASRLSYFLWSSMPDDRLRDLARAGTLHRPDTLRAEVRRMLADPKASEFGNTFPRQWLQLRKVGMFAPDKVLYPDYDDYLEKSMVDETVGFFGEMLARNASLREFLDSDWTLLNERLAAHYGIPGVSGEQMQRVALKPDDRRGGILTHASILSLTSDGTRHRPVHRGVWMLESIVGQPPPPPPANVPAFDTPSADTKKMSVRELLELHRADPNCTSCHRKIDPLGVAFDHYDAVGRWRAVESVRAGTGDDPAINAAGKLADGRTFVDAAGLKQLLVADLDRFAEAFTEKLATYALRRGVTFSDRAEIKRIAEHAKPDDYRLAALIETFVASDLFQKR